MSNTSLKQRLKGKADCATSALLEAGVTVPTELRALAAQLQLTVGSLEKLSSAQSSQALALVNRLEIEAGYYESGFETNAAQEVEALQQWLAEVPE